MATITRKILVKLFSTFYIFPEWATADYDLLLLQELVDFALLVYYFLDKERHCSIASTKKGQHFRYTSPLM